jgi:hypothetical protein
LYIILKRPTSSYFKIMNKIVNKLGTISGKFH